MHLSPLSTSSERNWHAARISLSDKVFPHHPSQHALVAEYLVSDVFGLFTYPVPHPLLYDEPLISSLTQRSRILSSSYEIYQCLIIPYGFPI